MWNIRVVISVILMMLPSFGYVSWVDDLGDDYQVSSKGFDKELCREIPPSFTANHGQLENEDVLFYVQGAGLWFTDSGVWFELKEYAENRDRGGVSGLDFDRINGLEPPEPVEYKRVVLKQEFVGVNQVRPVGKEILNWNSNYFYGANSENWCTNIPNYAEVYYENLYDGIDLRYYSNEKGLKYDFIVHPGGDPNEIKLRCKGSKSLQIDNSKNIRIQTSVGDIIDSGLYIYQDVEEDLNEISGRFEILDSLTYGFRIDSEYDDTKDLIIDPLIFSTFMGGNSFDYSPSMAIDSNNNLYVTSLTFSSDFPTTPGCYDSTFNGGNVDSVVFKLKSDGSDLLYSTYFGGGGIEQSRSITVDSQNNAYITGFTESANFPTTIGCYDDSHSASKDIFVLKLNSAGTVLMYSTYLGGEYDEIGHQISVDSNNNAYITGYTKSSNFPNTTGCYDESYNGDKDVIVSKLNPAGSKLLYSTFIGGSNDDWGNGLVLDINNNTYITGATNSTDFPMTFDYFDNIHNGNRDVFALKLNWNGSNLLYSTYIGGDSLDEGTSITIGAFKNVYITGQTFSFNFPTTTGCYDETYNGGGTYGDVFIIQLNSFGTNLAYSTFVGGKKGDYGSSIVIDPNNNVYVTGITESSDFPTTYGCYDETYNGNDDSYIFKLDTNGSKILYSTHLGGKAYDEGNSLVIESENITYITGKAESSDFPTTCGCYDESHNGGVDDIYVLKIIMDNRPCPPTGLAIQSIIGNKVTLAWESHPEADIAGYHIFINDTGAGSSGAFHWLETVNESITTYEVSNLRGETTYYFTISTFDELLSNSSYSNVVEITTTDITPPQPPTGLNITLLSPSKINLDWDDNPEADVEGYLAYINVEGLDSQGNFRLIQDLPKKPSSMVIDGLQEETTYNFKIRAYDEVPNNSPYSEIVSITLPDATPPSAPLGLMAYNPTTTSLIISWEPSPEGDVIGYNLFRSNEPDKDFIMVNSEIITSTQYTDSGLSEETVYYYKVQAIDDAELTSEFSKVVYERTKLGEHPPKIVLSVTNIILDEDTVDSSTINLKSIFTDVNDDPLTFKCERQNHIEVKVYQDDGTVILTPEFNWNGEESIQFSAFDGTYTTLLNVTVTVRPANDPPRNVQILEPLDGFTIEQGKPLNFSGTCDDPDLIYGDRLYYIWESNISGMLGDKKELTDIILPVGSQKITFKVNDVAKRKTSSSIIVEVLGPEDTTKVDPSGSAAGNIIEDNLFIIILVIVIVIIIILIAGIFISRKKKKRLEYVSPPSGFRGEDTEPSPTVEDEPVVIDSETYATEDMYYPEPQGFESATPMYKPSSEPAEYEEPDSTDDYAPPPENIPEIDEQQQAQVEPEFHTPKPTLEEEPPPPVEPQLETPQPDALQKLSTDNKLKLLEERFLRGEISENTYKLLKSKFDQEQPSADSTEEGVEGTTPTQNQPQLDEKTNGEGE